MSRVEELENEIKGLENRKIELLKELEVEKQKIEFEYPSLKIREMYWFINDEGLAFRTRWDEDRFDKRRCKIGNVFSTEEKAAKEVQKLSLLTRFRQFRDQCMAIGSLIGKIKLKRNILLYSIMSQVNCY